MPHRDRKLATTEFKETPMRAEAFKEWRKRLGLKQKDAAELLGLKKRMIQYYETGKRGGKDVAIPKSIRLACYALEAGILDYDGSTISNAPSPPVQTERALAESVVLPLAPDNDHPIDEAATR